MNRISIAFHWNELKKRTNVNKEYIFMNNVLVLLCVQQRDQSRELSSAHWPVSSFSWSSSPWSGDVVGFISPIAMWPKSACRTTIITIRLPFAWCRRTSLARCFNPRHRTWLAAPSYQSHRGDSKRSILILERKQLSNWFNLSTEWTETCL